MYKMRKIAVNLILHLIHKDSVPNRKWDKNSYFANFYRNDTM